MMNPLLCIASYMNVLSWPKTLAEIIWKVPTYPSAGFKLMMNALLKNRQ